MHFFFIKLMFLPVCNQKAASSVKPDSQQAYGMVLPNCNIILYMLRKKYLLTPKLRGKVWVTGQIFGWINDLIPHIKWGYAVRLL